MSNKVYTTTNTKTNTLGAQDQGIVLAEGANLVQTQVDSAGVEASFRMGQQVLDSGFSSLAEVLGTVEEIAAQNTALSKGVAVTNSEIIAGAYENANKSDAATFTPWVIAGFIAIGVVAIAASKIGRKGVSHAR